jgi:hypothetical protein
MIRKGNRYSIGNVRNAGIDLLPGHALSPLVPTDGFVYLTVVHVLSRYLPGLARNPSAALLAARLLENSPYGASACRTASVRLVHMGSGLMYTPP